MARHARGRWQASGKSLRQRVGRFGRTEHRDGRRLDDLAARRAARSGRVTDLILMGIGITSIASIALAISQFGRSAASDPLATGYDLGASDFTSWFAAQPVDVILLASAAASAVLVVLSLYFRRDDGAS